MRTNTVDINTPIRHKVKKNCVAIMKPTKRKTKYVREIPEFRVCFLNKYINK